MTEPTILPLFDLQALRDDDVSVEHIGGKALSLVMLLRAGLPVPPACVIPIPVCAAYFAADRTLPPELTTELESAVNSIERIAGRAFGSDLRFAVRSGAAVSMPGMLDSVLNIATWTELTQAIRVVLDSWMSPAAVAFRKAKNLDHPAGTAVIVQQMVDTTVAGVLFTRDPLNPHSKDAIIEAVRGTGDQLVSGAKSGQRWMISRDPLPAAEPCDETEPLLTFLQRQQLAVFGYRIEALVERPVDVEWGLDAEGRWHFFQARPIVFPGPAQDINVGFMAQLIERQNLRLAELRHQGDSLWVRHNLAESLPFPTPLTWSIWREFLTGSGGFGELYRLLGFAPSRRICRRGLAELIGGQIYASPQRLPDLFCTDFPFSFEEGELRRDPSAIDQAPHRLDLDRVGPWFLLRLPRILWVLWRARWRLNVLRRRVLASYEAVQWEHQRYVDDERRRALNDLSVNELASVMRNRIQRVLHHFAPRLMLPGVVGAATCELLRQSLKRLTNGEAADDFRRTLLQNLPMNCVTEMEHAIQHYQGGRLSDAEFQARYGHRGTNEMELAAPRWLEQPEHVPSRPDQNLVGQARQLSPDSLSSLLEEIFQQHGLACRHSPLRPLLEDAVRLLPYREIGKHEFLRGYDLLRDVAEALGKKAGFGEGIYFLELSELAGIDRDAARKKIAARMREREAWQQLSHPVLIDERGMGFSSADSGSDSVVLQGTAISLGTGKGIAWYPERHPRDLPPAGAVLVCSALPPHFVTYFTRTAAIVVDQSALLSHGAILARQFGIPLVSHPEATRTIREGAAVTVRGDTGCVEIGDEIPLAKATKVDR